MLSPNEVLWLVEFLKRSVPRGAAEEQILVDLVEKLESVVGLKPV